MTNFVLIGAAGYVAPRHMKAIRDCGGDLIAVLDPYDSVGVLDQFFPYCHYFKEFERFDRFIDFLRREGKKIDYVSVCSPSYLHDAHCRFGLRIGANVICEKPLVLQEKNLDGLLQLESETDRKIYSIMQLRLNQDLIKKRRDLLEAGKRHRVEAKYVTPRGSWYGYSWKGDNDKSGGLAVNIGVHLFDVMLFLFGAFKAASVTGSSKKHLCGIATMERATIYFYLSINNEAFKKAHRSIVIDDEEEFEISNGFTELHTESYKKILAGEGFGIEDVRPAIQMSETIAGVSAPWSEVSGQWSEVG